MDQVNAGDVTKIVSSLSAAGPIGYIVMIVLGMVVIGLWLKGNRAAIDKAKSESDKLANQAQAENKVDNQDKTDQWKKAEDEINAAATTGKKPRP